MQEGSKYKKKLKSKGLIKRITVQILTNLYYNKKMMSDGGKKDINFVISIMFLGKKCTKNKNIQK